MALRRITDPSQLESPSVTTMEVWTQFHRIPAHAVNNEGIYAIARKIGTPLTDVEEAFAAGLRYCKVKILIPIEQPLKEMVQFQHPLFGTQTIYTTYERITKLYAFCARVDHEIGACMDKVRFERLKQDPRFSNRQELQENPNPRVALWLTDPGLIPLNSSGPQRHSSTTQQPHAATLLPCFTAQPNPTQVTPRQSFQHRTNARNQRSRGPVGIFDNNQPWGPNYSSSNEGLDLNSLAAMMDHTNQVQQGALV